VIQGTVPNVRRAANLIKHQTLKQLKLRQGASRASADRFDSILAAEAAGHSTVFVHAGLSDISSAFETNPYKFLLDRLDDQFDNIIATGFTDYFKHSGVYHKEHSQPKNGTFVELFGIDVTQFSYPANDFSERVAKLVRQSHEIGLTRRGNRAFVDPDGDPALVPRVKGEHPSWRVRWELTDLGTKVRQRVQTHLEVESKLG